MGKKATKKNERKKEEAEKSRKSQKPRNKNKSDFDFISYAIFKTQKDFSRISTEENSKATRYLNEQHGWTE